jgi:hypothetical protein
LHRSDRIRDWDVLMRRLSELNIHCDRAQAKNKWKTMKQRFSQVQTLLASPSTTERQRVDVQRWRCFAVLQPVWGDTRAALQASSVEMGTVVEPSPAAVAAAAAATQAGEAADVSRTAAAAAAPEDEKQTKESEGASTPTPSPSAYSSHGPAKISRRSKREQADQQASARDAQLVAEMGSMINAAIAKLADSQQKNFEKLIEAMKKE